MMAPDQLERYREAVAADSTGRALEGILDDLSKRGFEVGHGMTEPLGPRPADIREIIPASTCCDRRW